MNVVAKEVVIPLVTPYMSDGLDAFWQSIKSWFVDYLWHLLKIQLWASLDWFSVVLIAVQGLLTLYLMLDKKHLAAFTARKIMHCGSGLILMLLNTDCLVIRLVIYAKCVIGLIMNWELLPRALPDFWFAVPDDLGITIYLLVVLIWVWMGHRLRVLAPVFLADPAGAIFGKIVSLFYPMVNIKVCGEKTLFGSLAVLVVTFATLWDPTGIIRRIWVSFLVTLAEMFGGNYDNLLMTLVVIQYSEVVWCKPAPDPDAEKQPPA